VREELWPGASLFNDGEYWEAHEAWEPPWMEARQRGDSLEAHYVQGLILLAAAIHKCRHYDSPRGGGLNLAKALRHLEHVPRLHDGLDLDALVLEVRSALEDPSRHPQLPLR
jgi:predicted metal-dependent hydrolase